MQQTHVISAKTDVCGVLQSLNTNSKKTVAMMNRVWQFTRIYKSVPTFWIVTKGDHIDFFWESKFVSVLDSGAMGEFEKMFRLEELRIENNNLIADFEQYR